MADVVAQHVQLDRVAELLDVTKAFLLAEARRGKLTVVRLSQRNVVIEVAELRRYLEEHRQDPATQVFNCSFLRGERVRPFAAREAT